MKPPTTTRIKLTNERRGTPRGKGTITPAHGGRIGNPPFIANDKQRKQVLEEVVFWGEEALAMRMGFHSETLRRHFRPEIDEANAKACAMIAGKLFKKALEGDGASQRFFLITRGKGAWSPKLKHEHSGPGGTPIPVDLNAFIEGKSEEELARIEDLLTQLAAAGGFAESGRDLVGDPASSQGEG